MKWVWRSAVSMLVALATTVVVLGPVPEPAEAAAHPVLFGPDLRSPTSAGAAAVRMPRLHKQGANSACLASGEGQPPSLPVCATSAVSERRGIIRLTEARPGQTGAAFSKVPVPTARGLEFSFISHQYGAGPAAGDGFSFFLTAADPAKPLPRRATYEPSVTVGPSSGGLGYASGTPHEGLERAYLGVGFDTEGSFSRERYSGAECADQPFLSDTWPLPGQVVIRGPRMGDSGFCGLTSTAPHRFAPDPVPLRARTRADAGVPVRLAINPTDQPLRTPAGAQVKAHSYLLTVTGLDGRARRLAGPLPEMTAGGWIPDGWLDPNGVPKQLTFGWLGSTVVGQDAHEISNARVVALGPLPQLTVTQRVAAAETLDWTSTFTQRIQVGVRDGRLSAEVVVTVDPDSDLSTLHGAGRGWTCTTDALMTCRHRAPRRHRLPELIITADAGNHWTRQRDQLSAPYVSVASDGANSAYTLESAWDEAALAPADLQTSPATPTQGQPLTISGRHLAGTTALRLSSVYGSTYLSSCATSPRRSPCFRLGSDGQLRVDALPAVAGGSVRLTVFTSGAATDLDLTYDSVPLQPTARAYVGGGAVTVNWDPPAATPPITGYVVTTYQDGRRTDSQAHPAGTTSVSRPDLDRSSTYAFAVAARNAVGPSPPSERTAALRPPNPLQAPVITRVVEHGAAPLLEWSFPTMRGVDSYVVTPYRNGVALPEISYDPARTSRRILGLGPGSYTFTVRVTTWSAYGGRSRDSAASSVVRVVAGPVAAWQDDATGAKRHTWDGEVGVPYAVRADRSLAGSRLRWTSEDDLPPGLTLDPATGTVAGTPTRAGRYAFRVTVVDDQGRTETDVFRLAIAERLSVVVGPEDEPAVVGTRHTWKLTAHGGYPPYSFAVDLVHPNAPWGEIDLPSGLRIDSETGEISGTPERGCLCRVPVIVADAVDNGELAPIELRILERPDLRLSVSTASARPGSTVTLSTPSLPFGGAVRFTRRTASGPDAGQSAELGEVKVRRGEPATLTTTVPAYGEIVFTVRTSGDDSYGRATSEVSVLGIAQPDDLLIREFRLAGPAGARDQYVELYNPGPPVPLAGFILAAQSGQRTVLPTDAPTLGTGRSYLVAASGYSLGRTARPDLVVRSLGTGGLRLHAPDPRLSAVDAVGPVDGPHLGRALPALTGRPRDQHTWWRRVKDGQPRTGHDNRSDFALLSTTGYAVGEVPAELGSPGPRSLRDGWAARSGALRIGSLDPGAGPAAVPNETYVPGHTGQPATVVVRRLLTNTSDAQIRRLRLRITVLGSAPGSTAPRVLVGGQPEETVDTSRGPVEVRRLSPGPPASAAGGGLNSRLEVPLPGGRLEPGGSVAVAVTFALEQHAGFWFGYELESS